MASHHDAGNGRKMTLAFGGENLGQKKTWRANLRGSRRHFMPPKTTQVGPPDFFSNMNNFFFNFCHEKALEMVCADSTGCVRSKSLI